MIASSYFSFFLYFEYFVNKILNQKSEFSFMVALFMQVIRLYNCYHLEGSCNYNMKRDSYLNLTTETVENVVDPSRHSEYYYQTD